MVLKILIILTTIFGLLFISAGIWQLINLRPVETIKYKYIPRTLDDIDDVSIVFDDMFNQRSPWVDSVRSYDVKKQKKIDDYFITKM